MSKPYEKPRIISADEAIIAELRAENERLRSCLSDAAENRRLIMGEYKQLREENERLRQELAIRDESEQEKVIDYLSEQSVDWEYRYRALVSENAKLRAERDYLLANSNPTAAELRRVRSAWKNDRDENEKLRELIADVHEALKADRAGMFHRLTLASMEDDMRELGIETERLGDFGEAGD